MFNRSVKYVGLEPYTGTGTLAGKAVTPVKLPTGHSTGMLFNGARLFIAIARAFLSGRLAQPDLSLEGKAVRYRFAPLIDGRFRNLRIRAAYLSHLRDFSLSTRIGELGQGLSWLFAQEKLSYLYVVDFRYYVKKKWPAVAITGRKSTPDYILTTGKRLSLLESKATTGVDKGAHNVALRDGILQCEEGRRILNANGAQVTSEFSVVSVLAKDPTGNSYLYFADPGHDEPEVADPFDLIRLHYASWFALAGDYETKERLSSFKAPQEDHLIDSRPFSGRRFLIVQPSLDHGDEGTWAADLDREFFTETQWGIDEEVWHMIVAGEDINRLPEIKPRSNSEAELFSDGTILFLPR